MSSFHVILKYQFHPKVLFNLTKLCLRKILSLQPAHRPQLMLKTSLHLERTILLVLLLPILLLLKLITKSTVNASAMGSIIDMHQVIQIHHYWMQENVRV
jgi:hypothetical protein